MTARQIAVFALCAATGDIQALTDLVHAHPHNIILRRRAAAFLALDDDPDPLALLVVAALQDDEASPAMQQCASARSRSALMRLVASDAAALRDALLERNIMKRVVDLAIDHCVVLADSARHDPRLAAVFGDRWHRLPEIDRSSIAASVARHPPSATALALHAGTSGLRSLDTRIVRDLLVAMLPAVAACATPERVCAVISAADHAGAAMAWLALLGSDGWRSLDAAARASLLAVIARTPRVAAQSVDALLWSALTPAERRRIALSAVREAESACRLIAQIGACGWNQLDLASQNALEQTIVPAALNLSLPQDIAGTALHIVWTATPPGRRRTVWRRIMASPHLRYGWFMRLEPRLWQALDATMRMQTLQSAIDAGYAAVIAHLWDALSAREQRMAVRRAGNDAVQTAILARIIGYPGVMRLSASDRQSLVNALLPASQQGDSICCNAIAELWSLLSPLQQQRALGCILRDALAAAHWVQRHAAWKKMPSSLRRRIMDVMAHSPSEAAVTASITWSALQPEERERLLTTVMRSADAAADWAMFQWETLHASAERLRRRMAYALLGDNAADTLAYAMQRGAQRRPWMDVLQSLHSRTRQRAAPRKMRCASTCSRARPYATSV